MLLKLLSRAFQRTCTTDKASPEQLAMPLNKLPDRNLELERRIWNGQSENLKRIADFEGETQSLKLLLNISRDKNSKKEREINDFLTQICSLKVRKSQKQFFMASILPKSKHCIFIISVLASKIGQIEKKGTLKNNL